MIDIRKACGSVPLVPVLTIEHLDSAVPLAQALVAAGLTVLEITLRTESALSAIKAMRAACPDARTNWSNPDRPARSVPSVAEQSGQSTPGSAQVLAGLHFAQPAGRANELMGHRAIGI